MEPSWSSGVNIGCGEGERRAAERARVWWWWWWARRELGHGLKGNKGAPGMHLRRLPISELVFVSKKGKFDVGGETLARFVTKISCAL